MTSFVYLNFAVFFFFLLIAGFAEENPTSTPGSTNVPTDQQLRTENFRNVSTICRSDEPKLRINESDFKNILRLMHKYTTNVVEINVVINSKNNFPQFKWSWASEIGRTIISLIARESSVFNLFSTRSIHLITLRSGIEKVNVVVSENKHGCLPAGTNGSELVFDVLLRELSRLDDMYDYKLCRVHQNEENVKKYNCCRVTRDENQMICADYSSIVLEYANSYIIVISTIFFIFIAFPLLLNNLLSFEGESEDNEVESYKITDSPMALSYIFHSLLLETSKKVEKNVYRKLTSLFVIGVILCVSYLGIGWIVFSLLWATIIFIFTDFYSINEEVIEYLQGDKKCSLNRFKRFLVIFTLPLNLKYCWELATKFDCLEFGDENSKDLSKTKRFKQMILQVMKVLFFLTFYPFYVFITFCVALCFLLNLCWHIFVLQYEIALYMLFIVPVVFFFFTTLLNFALYLLIGFYLNGPSYGPILTAVITFFAYSWKYWRSFVERKYLQLKTKIYEVCKERNANNGNIPQVENNNEKLNQCRVNIKDGAVSKALYDALRKKILPYNEGLFFFSIRIFYVFNFCAFLLIIISLAQESNISGPAQLTSTFVLATLPLLFSVTLAEDTFEQKHTQDERLKQEIINLIAKTTKISDDTVTVVLTTECNETNAQDVICSLVPERMKAFF